MRDDFNELSQFSVNAGELFLETVPGDTNGKREAENEAVAAKGADRTMYLYAPVSGMPHPKQTQVLMVLRDDDTLASAKKVMKDLALDALAEERHFLLLFPNPQKGGWNDTCDENKEDDISYLIRCFAMLKTSQSKVSGFNGMIFYLAVSERASSFMMTMAAKKPLNVPAMMISAFPEGYEIPQDALHVETAAYVSGNPKAVAYLKQANGVSSQEEEEGVTTYFGTNPNVRLLVTERPIDEKTMRLAWERLFSETRRWQNDTYGTYQKRTNFTKRGFIAHVKDTSLGVNQGHPHTWYEYVPEFLRGSEKKVPLLFNFHGGGCVPLYAVEQSGWHDVAEREGFICCFPQADQKAMWNVWKEKDFIDDDAFFLALLDHMKKTYPIDESRIYISGFSMGGMMSNAMAALHPDLIAAAAPCNAYHSGYFCTYASLMENMARPGGQDNLWRCVKTEEKSRTCLEADAKKASYDYRMPLMQVSGLLDQPWPIFSAEDARIETFNYWKAYDHIPVTPFVQSNLYESGLTADKTCYEGNDERFLHHVWYAPDTKEAPLYEVFLTKRCPHALDIRTADYMWNFMKKFRRNPDGSLSIEE